MLKFFRIKKNTFLVDELQEIFSISGTVSLSEVGDDLIISAKYGDVSDRKVSIDELKDNKIPLTLFETETDYLRSNLPEFIIKECHESFVLKNFDLILTSIKHQ